MNIKWWIDPYYLSHLLPNLLIYATSDEVYYTELFQTRSRKSVSILQSSDGTRLSTDELLDTFYVISHSRDLNDGFERSHKLAPVIGQNWLALMPGR